MISKLIKYEIKDRMKYITVLVITFLIWNTYLITRIGDWQEGYPFVVMALTTWVVPLFILKVIDIIRAVNEFNTSSGYLLFTLPVKGSDIIISKVLVSIFELAIVSLMSVAVLLVHIAFTPADMMLIPSIIVESFNSGAPIVMYAFSITIIVFPVILYFSASLANIILSMKTKFIASYQGRYAISSLLVITLILAIIYFAGSAAYRTGLIFNYEKKLDFSFISQLHNGFEKVLFYLNVNFIETVIYLIPFAIMFMAASRIINKKISV